jgi:hypothetical protein
MSDLECNHLDQARQRGGGLDSSGLGEAGCGLWAVWAVGYHLRSMGR